MKCPNCNYENTDDVFFCENCGIKLPEERFEKKPPKTKKWIALSSVFIVLLGFGATLYFSGIGGQWISQITAGTSFESEKNRAMESAYQRGMECMLAQEYPDAISAFSEVERSHYRYQDAQKNIGLCASSFASDIQASVDELRNKNDYKAAYDLLDSAYANALEDNDNLQKELDELKREYRDYLLSQAKACNSEKNYDETIKILSNCDKDMLPKNDKKIASELTQATKEYRSQVLSVAENYAKDGDYSAATEYLHSSLSALPDDEAIIAKIEEYSSMQPVSLYDLEYFDAFMEAPYQKEEMCKLNDGKEYEKGLLFHPSTGDDTTWVDFKIDGQYSTFSGKLGIAFKDRTSKHKDTIKVYGDNVLLYTSDTFTSGVEPQDFTIDISGVQHLKIECTGTYSESALFDYFAYVCIVDSSLNY